MQRMLLDGTFLVDLHKEVQRDQRGPARRFAEAHDARVALSVVSVAEFLEGQANYREGFRWLKSRFQKVLEITQPVAVVAGAMQRVLRAQGRQLGENDAWQAALCLYHGLAIVSRDNRFSHVPRLKALRHAR